MTERYRDGSAGGGFGRNLCCSRDESRFGGIGFVNLGAAGEQLRRLGFLPILILFLVFSQIDVFGSAIEWTDHVRVGTVILLGGG